MISVPNTGSRVLFFFMLSLSSLAEENEEQTDGSLLIEEERTENINKSQDKVLRTITYILFHVRVRPCTCYTKCGQW